MTQIALITKFSDYLEQCKEEHILELDRQFTLFPERFELIKKQKIEFTDRIDALIKNLSSGLCFGLSIVHASMDIMGKLDWWEHAIIELTQWEKENISLNTEIHLPQESKPIKLRELFERALHYLVNTHASKLPYFENISQSNILQPDANTIAIPASKIHPELQASEFKRSYFEILDSNNELKTIQKREVIAGYFTKDQLMNVLDDTISENIIILIHQTDHTIRLARKGSHWMIYNANYNHTRLSTIHKQLTKSECVEEIFKIQGHAIAIEAAAFDKDERVDFPYYDLLLNTSSIELFNNGGFRMMAEYMPDKLTTYFKQHPSLFNDNKAFILALIAELPKNDLDGWSALQIMARYSESLLIQFIELIDKAPEGMTLLQDIINELKSKTPTDWTTLDLMAHNSPDALLELIKRIDQTSRNTEFYQKLAHELGKSNPEGWLTLHIIAQYAPKALQFFLAKNFTKQHELFNIIVEKLTAKLDSDWTTLQIIAKESPGALVEIIKQIDNSPEGYNLCASIVGELSKKVSANWSTLQLIARYSPFALLELIKVINIFPQKDIFLNVIIHGLTEKLPSGRTTLQVLMEQLPDSIFSPSDRDKIFREILCSAFINLIINEINKGNIEDAATINEYLQNMIGKLNGLDDLLKTLAEKIDYNITRWEQICKKFPSLKMQIIDAMTNYLSKMNETQLDRFEDNIRQIIYLNHENTENTLLFANPHSKNIYQKVLSLIEKNHVQHNTLFLKQGFYPKVML